MPRAGRISWRRPCQSDKLTAPMISNYQNIRTLKHYEQRERKREMKSKLLNVGCVLRVLRALRGNQSDICCTASTETCLRPIFINGA